MLKVEVNGSSSRTRSRWEYLEEQGMEAHGRERLRARRALPRAAVLCMHTTVLFGLQLGVPRKDHDRPLLKEWDLSPPAEREGGR